MEAQRCWYAFECRYAVRCSKTEITFTFPPGPWAWWWSERRAAGRGQSPGWGREALPLWCCHRNTPRRCYPTWWTRWLLLQNTPSGSNKSMHRHTIMRRKQTHTHTYTFTMSFSLVLHLMCVVEYARLTVSVFSQSSQGSGLVWTTINLK